MPTTIDTIIGHPEPAHVRAVRVGMLNRRVSFDFHVPGGGGARVRKTGRVVGSRWLGLINPGRVPEAELTIEGSTGARVTARVSGDHVQPVE